MSAFVDRIRNHPVFSELSALGPAIDAALDRQHTDPTAAVDGLERLRAVLAYSGKRLAALDPAIADPRPLNSIHGALSNARALLDGYKTDGNLAHIVKANEHADDTLGSLSAVPAIQTSDDLTTINAAAGSYRSTLNRYLSESETSVKKLTSETATVSSSLQQLSSEITAEREKLTKALAEQQTTFSTAQDTRAQEFTTAQTKRQESATTAEAEFSRLFTAGQAAYP